MADTEHFVRKDVAAFLGLVNSLPAPDGPPDPVEQRQGYLMLKQLTDGIQYQPVADQVEVVQYQGDRGRQFRQTNPDQV